ncbi:MAG: putative ABC transport system permease protein [Parcubacteria group bacterium Gr01-1014_30]|nr:MAG: putative ABC transport system permease protein [Parcubacteria group bacterium Gr01-1014_30]
MKLEDLLQETVTALSSNKARSGLTILGIVIGIASVIAMISIGQGVSEQIKSSIEGLGSNLLTVMPGFIQPGRGVVSAGRGTAESLEQDDVEIIREIDGVVSVSPEVQRRFQVVSETGNNTNTLVLGILPEYLEARNVFVQEGSFITDANVRALGRVVVLGPTVAEDIFSAQDPIGRTIRISGMNFKVIGLLQSKGSAGFFNPDDAVFIPLTTMQKVITGEDFLSAIAVSVASEDRMPLVQAEITQALAKKHRVDPENPDFSILSQADIIGALTQVTTTFTIFLAAVAGISLIVGGIGIMNMMLTTVKERTREIGLRKAIGAKRCDISRQFLAEAVALTFLGGVLGIILGWAVSFAVSHFAGLATKVSPGAILLAFLVASAIGIIFGYYPAKRAAGLNPIEALRYE